MSSQGLAENLTNLEDQVAIVTGATSGLGLRFSKLLASYGATVVIAGRREDRLNQVAEDINQSGGTCLPVGTDVADAAQLSQLVDRAEEKFGLVTTLVNNAGIADGQFATKIEIDQIDRVLDVNVRAPYILSREVARRLIKAKQTGRIVNIASMIAYETGDLPASIYAVSKAAVVRMTEALAVEWSTFGINVNGIAPGFFKSEMTDGMAERMGRGEEKFDLTKLTKRNRVPTPDMLDSTLLYLCSPISQAVTGTVVKVDDGQLGR